MYFEFTYICLTLYSLSLSLSLYIYIYIYIYICKVNLNVLKSVLTVHDFSTAFESGRIMFIPLQEGVTIFSSQDLGSFLVCRTTPSFLIGSLNCYPFMYPIAVMGFMKAYINIMAVI
jgi:hypothetical protein